MGRVGTVVVGVVGILTMALAGCGNGSSTSSSSSSGAAANVGSAAMSGLGTPVVTINETDQMKFEPAAASAKVGDVVEWTNTGSLVHNVNFDAYSALSSGSMSQGDTWQVKFTQAGTYKYTCTFHSGMDGTITVS